jgi:Ni/Co efflux regulator RcnB
MLRKAVFSAALAASFVGIAGTAYADPPWWARSERREAAREEHRDRVEERREERRHEWVRGERFVPRGEVVVVRDWRVMHLAPPRYGFHWVREGDFFLMINNWNGIVEEVVPVGY